MTIAVTEEHQALRDSVARWAEDRGVREQTRAASESAEDAVPEFLKELGAQGLLGLHVAERHGGGGATLVETAIVLEQLGAAMAYGPILPTLLASAVLARAGGAAADDLLPGLVDGSLVGAVAWNPGGLALVEDDGTLRLDGDAGLVLGAGCADVVLVGADTADGERWAAVDAHACEITSVPNLDGGRRVARVGCTAVAVPADRLVDGVDRRTVQDLAVTLTAAELAGVAGWCVSTTSAYAKVREQFGRPIGQFQAVKHTCARMLADAERIRAVAWDAARAAGDPEQLPLAAAVAGAVALDAAARCAKDCIQMHGGIGFTWDHDAHLYLRRAIATRQLLGPAADWERRVSDLVRGGARRVLELELPPEAEPIRVEVRELADELAPLAPYAQRKRLVETGYLFPHWPEPWGRGAGAVEQLVIAEELDRVGIEPPSLLMSEWAAATIIQHGSPEQQERFVRTSILGDIIWCQLFSEPGAGSDLASLRTKAERVDGGWVINGQKVWTSLAQHAQWGMCIARTDPDAPKREGITYFLVDMSSPGVEVRPLRELTGHSLFNEVFLNDVFVPDELVVGEVNKGWPLARSTLSNERVSMSTGTFDKIIEQALDIPDDIHLGDSDRERLGALLAEGQTISLLNQRTTLRKVSGIDPGAAVSVGKLLAALHQQDVTEFTLGLLGDEGATMDGKAASWGLKFLTFRSTTIAGGTTEVQLNVIGERILGLPRDDT